MSEIYATITEAQPILVDLSEAQPIYVSLGEAVNIYEGNLPGEADKHYEYNLSGETDVTVSHNLNKIPAVTIIDSAGDEVVGDYQHINNTNTRLIFSAGFSGKAIFN